jgi:TonB family protein
MKRYILPVMVGIFLSTLGGASDSSEQRDARKKLEQAISKTNIFDLPSFQMKAAVQIDNGGKLLDGSYRLLWNGPEQWREEIAFPGYTELQVGGKGTVWVQRSTDFLPLGIYELHAALGLGSGVADDAGGHYGSFIQPGLTPNDKIKKLHTRKEGSVKLTCIETENGMKGSSEICVNEGTGTLFRGSSYEDGDLQAVGEKVFPRFLGFVDKGKTVVKVKVNELIASDQFPPNAFIPPTGVSAEPGCMNPAPYRQIKSLAPDYPADARQQHIQGTVAVDVLIGNDGIPKIRKVVASPTASLARSSQTAIAGWRYEPATCEGKPVQVETVLRINYTLSR